MGKRSPILGYNHNVRHRGLIFHVQTEDSGVDNPHIFTHLFHGGVIISTRKLTYDRESAEESIKSLMQAQHKAVLKDLKAATFDPKIDSYLGGTPGLEPSAAAERERRDTLVSTPPPEILPPELDEIDDSVTPPAGSTLGEAVLSRATQERMPSQVPAAPRVVAKPPTIPPLVATRPAPPTRPPAKEGKNEDDVSAAFRAISQDDAPGAAEAMGVPMAVIDDQTDPTRHDTGGIIPLTKKKVPQTSDGVPQGSAHDPPSGAYSEIRIGKRDSIAPLHDQPTAPVQRKRDGSGPIMPPIASKPGQAPKPGTRPPGPPPISSLPPRPAPAGGSGTRPQAKPMPSPAAPQPRAGVVVSRPAVIIGGPPKVVGAREPEARPPASRRAREEPTRPNLFGKDLISEKSLDEVILAYLSEDGTEES